MALAVDHGTVSVTYGNRANSLIADHTLSFRPSLTDMAPSCGRVAMRAESRIPMPRLDLTSLT
jgi:hypothetical protein